MILVPIDYGLDADVIKGLRNKQFREEEIQYIFESVKERKKRMKRKVIMIDTIIFIIMVLLCAGLPTIALNYGYADEMTSRFVMIIVCGVLLMIIFFLDLMYYRQMQFRKLLKKYYPELASRYTKEAFK